MASQNAVIHGQRLFHSHDDSKDASRMYNDEHDDYDQYENEDNNASRPLALAVNQDEGAASQDRYTSAEVKRDNFI